MYEKDDYPVSDTGSSEEKRVTSPDAPLLIYWKLMGAKTKVKLKKAVPFRAQEVILSNVVYAYLHSSGTSGTLFSRRPILSL